MKRPSLTNKLLTTTAALSVVLGTLPPLPLLAQETTPIVPPTEETTPVVPEAEVPAAPEVIETPEVIDPPVEEVVPSEEPPAAEPAPEAPAVEEPAPVEDPAPVEEPVPEEPAAEEPAPETPATEAPATEAPAAEEPAAEEPAAEQPVAPEAAEPEMTPDTQPAPEATPEPESAPAQEPAAAPEAEVEAEQPATPAEQTAEPSEEAVDVLNTLLGGGAAAGAAAAAGDDAQPAGEATTTTITESDSRSSSEDFSTTASGERRNNDDRGLSNLQKVGLLALGGLAVGALLNNGNEVVSNTGDRVVVRQPDGQFTVLKDDDTLLRQPGSTVRTENFTDGSTRSTLEYDDGSRVVTIRDATGRVLRRSRIDPQGNEVRLIDDTTQVAPVDVSSLPPVRDEFRVSATDRGSLRDALNRIEARDNARAYSLAQIRDYRQVRALAPVVDVENITFRTGSAAVDATQAEQLSDLGNLLTDLIKDNPREVFLIEGHTDAVGSASSNLALSDRRAESVALALTEYFNVRPENLVVQGYGESDLRVETERDEPRNRRVAVRIITPILQTAQAR